MASFDSRFTKYLATGDYTPAQDSAPMKNKSALTMEEVVAQDAAEKYLAMDAAFVNGKSAHGMTEYGHAMNPDGKMPKSLEEHDKVYHPNGYKEGDSCKFRENLEKKDDADKINVDKSEAKTPKSQAKRHSKEEMMEIIDACHAWGIGAGNLRDWMNGDEELPYTSKSVLTKLLSKNNGKFADAAKNGDWVPGIDFIKDLKIPGKEAMLMALGSIELGMACRIGAINPSEMKLHTKDAEHAVKSMNWDVKKNDDGVVMIRHHSFGHEESKGNLAKQASHSERQGQGEVSTESSVGTEEYKNKVLNNPSAFGEKGKTYTDLEYLQQNDIIDDVRTMGSEDYEWVWNNEKAREAATKLAILAKQNPEKAVEERWTVYQDAFANMPMYEY